MFLRPIRDKVLIESEEISLRTSSGLYLPSTRKNNFTEYGFVRAIGEDVVSVSIGDRVFLGRIPREHVKGNYYIVKEIDIQMICNE